MMHQLVILIVYACLCSSVSSSVYYMNATALELCTTTTDCYFLDASLWNNNIPPQSNDTALIQNAPANTLLNYNYTTFSLFNLQINGNVNLTLQGNAQLIINQGLSIAQSVVSLTDSATLFCNAITTILGGQLIINTGGGFQQTGSISVSSDSILNVQAGFFILHMEQLSYLGGKVIVKANSTFYSSGAERLYINNNNNDVITFENSPVIYNVDIRDSQIKFMQGWQRPSSVNIYNSTITIYSSKNGSQSQVFPNFFVDQASTLAIRGISDCSLVSPNITGTLWISSSLVTVTQITGALNAALVLGGIVALRVQNIVINKAIVTIGEHYEPTSGSITADTVVCSGSLLLLGELDFYVNEYLEVSGTLDTYGSITSYGTLVVNPQALMVSTSLLIGSSAVASSAFVSGQAHLGARFLTIGANSILTAKDSTISALNFTLLYNSTLVNHNNTFTGFSLNSLGHIRLTQSDFQWPGDYIQGEDGTLDFYNIDLNSHTNAIFSAKSLTLNGGITYTLAPNTVSQKDAVEVFVIYGTLLGGSFSGSPQNVGQVRRDGDSEVEYKGTQIYILFKGHEGSEAPQWWIWLLVAIAVVMLGVILVFYIGRRRRTSYSAVPQ